MNLSQSTDYLREWSNEAFPEHGDFRQLQEVARTVLSALDKTREPWHRMNLFQPMVRLREWAEALPENAMSIKPKYIAEVQADALHVLNRHDLLHHMAEKREKRIWYQTGSEGNGNLDISWQEIATEASARLVWLAKRLEGTKWRDISALEPIKPEDEKYITADNLMEAIDSQLEKAAKAAARGV